MDHSAIERNSVIERYLLRQLPQPEEEAFEEHLLGCSSCLRQLDEAEDFQTSLRAAVAEDVARTTLRAGILGWLRRHDQLAIGLLFGVLLLAAPSTFLWWQNQQLSEQLSRPQANPLLVTLSTTRGDNADFENPIEVHSRGDEPINLTFELALVEYDTYHFSLQAAATRQATATHQATSTRQATNDKLPYEATLRPTPDGRLGINFPPSFLAPGDYLVRISAANPGEGAPSRLRVLSTVAIRIVAVAH